MAKCLRCGAGNEWLQGDVKPESESVSLITAAPDLLEALERVMVSLGIVIDHVDLDRTTVSGQVTLDVSYAAMDQARAAIKKAKGDA